MPPKRRAATSAADVSAGPLVFEIQSDTTSADKIRRLDELLNAALPPEDFVLGKIVASRMLDSGWATKRAATELFAQKTRLDAIFDSGQYPTYKRVGERLFPQDRSGGEGSNLNRAGDKLEEVLSAAPQDFGPKIAFVDVCGAPGAFSAYFLSSRPDSRGWGITLRSTPQIHRSGHIVIAGVIPESETLGALVSSGRCTATPVENGLEFELPSPDLFHENTEIAWYPVLVKRPNFEVYWGPSGTGNVYLPANLRGLAETVLAETQRPPRENSLPRRSEAWGHALWTPAEDHDESGADIVGADGGFELAPIGAVHYDNLQELFCARIVASECLSALQTLRPGGTFVCKLFDTLSDLSASVVYLMLAAFEAVKIVKPKRSRASNSERYLMCHGFHGRGAARPVLEVLTYAHEMLFLGIPGVDPLGLVETPLSLYPLADIQGAKLTRGFRGGDVTFRKTFGASVTVLLERQTTTLRTVLDATDAELAARGALAKTPPRPETENEAGTASHAPG